MEAMSFFRRPPPPPEPPSVEVWNSAEGLLLAGDPAAVEQVVEMLTTIHQREPESPLPTGLPSGPQALAVYATGFADGATSGQYIRHTPAGLRLLEKHGAIPNGAGGYRAIVHDGNRIAGQLDWEMVSMGPERALAFQNAAIGMALQTAIKSVEEAIERVEDKVDQVIGMIRVGRIGDVLGIRRTLTPLVERLDSTGRLSPVDWSTVAALGPAINIDIETLRAQIRFLLADLGDGDAARARAAGVEALLGDGLLAETLALLLVAEHNESLWARLRLAEIDRADPSHTSLEVQETTAALRGHNDEDQQLLDELVAAGVDLLTPAPLDGFAVRPARRLKRAEAEFANLMAWFAEQRHLEASDWDASSRPTLIESTRYVIDQARDGAGATRRRLDPRQSSGKRTEPELTERTSSEGESAPARRRSRRRAKQDDVVTPPKR